MLKTLKILLFFAFLFNVIIWSGFTKTVTQLSHKVKTNHKVSKNLCHSKSKNLSNKPKLTKAKKPIYNFLPYEVCDKKNDYLNEVISKSSFLNMEMKNNKLSPLCTFAGLDHKLRGAYQKSCKSRPKFTSQKPCLNRNYHRFVHNQITMAAECFHMDPKTLFSLYSTESFLQVNVKPSSRESAEGISQLMPQYAVKHINQKIFSNNYSRDNQYKKNLRHFQSIAPNQQCFDYLKKLEKTVLKKERKNKCHTVNIDQRVSQDIYYSIAYGLESIKTNIRYLIKKKSLFKDDYSQFFNQQKDYKKASIINCSNKPPIDQASCFQSSKNQVQNYIAQGQKQVENTIKHLSKTINPISAKNLEDKIVNNFPQFVLHVTTDQFAESKITSFLDNDFVKNYCQIDTLPQLSWYKTDTNKQKISSAHQLVKDIKKLLSEVRDCQQQLSLAYVDIFNSMGTNSQRILNEVSFYQHNGGTKMNGVFKKYIRYLGPRKASNLSYQRFTGKRRGSFRSYIIKVEGPSQASNFLFNTPGFDRRGRRIAGSLASTSHNMKIIKKTLSNIKERTHALFKLSNKQSQYLEQINSSSGFNKLCSHY